MNSQFKNSNLGFYLYASIIIMIAFASVFVVWYMVTGYSLGTYKENTILGSVYIGGLREEEVEPIIEERIARWKNDESIVFELTYQEYTYVFNRELFYFDQELSMFYLEDGMTNKLFAKYQGEERIDIVSDIKNLDFLIGISDEFDIEDLLNDILIDAGFMKSYSSKKLENYVLDQESFNVDVSTIDLRVFDGIDVDALISGINAIYPDGRILVESKELYDITSELGETLASNELSILSTGMLALILETNFAINEIHYKPEIDYINYDMDDFPFFGHNSKVDKAVGNGFSFYNPNNSVYYFKVEKIDEQNITVTLVGLEFIDDIVVVINKTVLDHITQHTVDDELVQSGYDGAIIEVTRIITDIQGNIRYENVILFEFYPPIKEIIIEP